MARKLIVGTKHVPPFALKNADGQWKGISIELWRHLADELDLEYELREMTLDEMLAGLESGELDAAVAAISVTAERHERVEFCHPHFTTGLGIAVSASRSTSSWSLVRRIVSWRVLAIVAVMFVIICTGGMLFWLVERRRNQTLFGDNRRQGVGLGVWWSLILLLGPQGDCAGQPLGPVPRGLLYVGEHLVVVAADRRDRLGIDGTTIGNRHFTSGRLAARPRRDGRVQYQCRVPTASPDQISDKTVRPGCDESRGRR